jgi:8-oxo-dGTP pyrophosphatase MutT (NUDIX family)
MTAQSSRDTSENTIGSITDPESFRNRDDVPFHEDRDVIDGETFEMLNDLGDMAPVGVTNNEGEVLLMKVNEDCTRKIPSASVAPDEDFVQSAQEWVEEQAGLTIAFDALEGVWYFEGQLENEEQTATRYFVVFSASPVADGSGDDELAGDIPEKHNAADVGWFDELPDDAAEVPGTQVFFNH